MAANASPENGSPAPKVETVQAAAPRAASAEVGNEEPGLLDLAQLLTPKANPEAGPAEPEPKAKAPAKGDDGKKVLSQLAEPDDEDEGDEPKTPPDGNDDDEPDDAAPTDEAEGDDPKAPKEWDAKHQEAFNRAIQKEKAKRSELMERLEAAEGPLQEEIQRLRAENAGLLETVSATEADTAKLPKMVADVKDEAELRTAEDNARKYHKWSERQLERLRYRPTEVESALKAEGVKLEEYSEEAMAEYLLRVKENAGDVLEAVPKRREVFQRRGVFAERERDFSAQAERLVPWLKKADAPEMALFNQVVAEMPEIKRRPNWKALAAAHVEGLKVLKARAEKVAGAATPRPKTPVRSAAEPAPVDPKAAARAAAFSKVKQNGGRIEDLAALLA
jgi:hypothetical protein